MAREYPENPLPSCHAVVRRQEQVLLVQRARPPFEGYYTLPGGGVELGETVEEALVREVREETGLQVRVTRFLGYVNAIERDQGHRVRWHYVIFYFEAELVDGIERPGDDAAALKWVTVGEARQHRLTDSVERCFQWLGLCE